MLEMRESCMLGCPDGQCRCPTGTPIGTRLESDHAGALLDRALGEAFRVGRQTAAAYGELPAVDEVSWKITLDGAQLETVIRRVAAVVFAAGVAAGRYRPPTLEVAGARPCGLLDRHTEHVHGPVTGAFLCPGGPVPTSQLERSP